MSISFDVRHSIATQTLDRPEKKNALDDATIAELKQGIAQADKDHADQRTGISACA